MRELTAYPQPDVQGDVEQIYDDVAQILLPPNYVDMVDFAGTESKVWDKDLARLFHAPMRDLTKREYKSVVFVGSARTGKTFSLVQMFIAYTMLSDPVDMGIYLASESMTSYFSKKLFGVDMMSDMPQLQEQIRAGGGDETVYTKILRSGAIVSFGWPTVTQLAAKTFVRVILSDIDRARSVGNEGDFFTLAAKRTTTSMSRGMVLAESSPGRPIADPEYVPKSNHEPPPTTGILGLYANGNRQIVYGQCPHCDEYFPPNPDASAFHIDKELPRKEMIDKAFMICTVCGGEIHHEHEIEFKRSGVWVGDGQEVDTDGVVHGELIHSTMASYWLVGWFAAFISWRQILVEYVDALSDYELTGNEDRLKTVYNTTFSAPYLEYARRIDTSVVGVLMERAEPLERYIVPKEARVLLAAVDIQGGRQARFVVQVMAYGVHGERWVVDRYSIAYREDGGRVSPHSQIEDWDLLTQKVVNSTYRIEGSEDQEMRVYRTAVDSGGSAGTTERAYEWYRTLKKQGFSKRVQLIKGGSEISYTSPIIKISYPDATTKADRYSGARGDVPLMILNTLLLKDAVKASMDREDIGSNYFHFSDWLTENWYKELTAEVRTDKKWVSIASRNESFDLCVYSHSLWALLLGHQVKWDSPPSWCAPHEFNSEVMTREERLIMKDRPLKKVKRRNRFRFNG